SETTRTSSLVKPTVNKIRPQPPQHPIEGAPSELGQGIRAWVRGGGYVHQGGEREPRGKLRDESRGPRRGSEGVRAKIDEPGSEAEARNNSHLSRELYSHLRCRSGRRSY